MLIVLMLMLSFTATDALGQNPLRVKIIAASFCPDTPDVPPSAVKDLFVDIGPYTQKTGADGIARISILPGTHRFIVTMRPNMEIVSLRLYANDKSFDREYVYGTDFTSNAGNIDLEFKDEARSPTALSDYDLAIAIASCEENPPLPPPTPVPVLAVIEEVESLLSEVTVGGTDNVEAAYPGMELHELDSLKVVGFARMRWADGTILEFGVTPPTPRETPTLIGETPIAKGPPTNIVIEKGLDGTPSPKVLAGSVKITRWVVQPGGFRIITDYLTASSKNTIFSVSHDEQTQVSTVAVEEGEVEVTPTNPSLQPFNLQSGQQVQVNAESIGPITPFSPTPTQPDVIAGNIQILDHAVASNVDESSGNVITRTNTFYSTDSRAYAWLKLGHVSNVHKVEWKWYSPDGNLYGTYSRDIPQPSGAYWDYYWVDSSFPIAGYDPANMPGNWHVDVYLDGQKLLTELFTIGDSGISGVIPAKPLPEVSGNGIPETLQECEAYGAEICGTWTLEVDRFNANWDTGDTGTVRIERWDAGGVVLTRYETEGISAGLSTRYDGQISGNKIENGIVTWTLGEENWSGTWSAEWTEPMGAIGTGISASPTAINPGDTITVTYSGAPGFENDWIAIFKVGDPNTSYNEYLYLHEQKSGTLTFTAPTAPGEYEFRMFENFPEGGYNDLARSNTIQVA